MAGAPSNFKPKLWVSGDLNAFFGFFTNVLLNVLVLSSLVLYVVELPGDIVFGRILPALGIALPFGNLFYAWMAYKKAKELGRDTVTALPYGPSVPPMFLVVFVVMLPTALSTGDHILAWKLGLIWAMIVGVITLLGAFIGPAIRKYTPRAAMLGTLAGVSIAFISMRPSFLIFDTAWIGIVCFMIVLISWVGHVRLPYNIPGGLAIVIVGGVLAWGGVALGMTDIMKPQAVGEAFANFGFHYPVFGLEVLSVPMDKVIPLLVTAIPLGIYNFTEAINNVESAAAGGDEYNLRAVLIADGAGAVIGSFLGSPFPPAVYIGHPGWKAMGGRIGYSLGTGIAVSTVCILGLTAFLLSIIPLVAIIPILLFIGLVIGSQAFQACQKRHAPAIVLALVPNLASWAQTQVNGALGATGINPDAIPAEIINKMSTGGVLYDGMASVGGGSVVGGLMLGAIAVFVIDRRFNWAAVYAAIASALSFTGFIHGTKLAFNASPSVTAGYAMAAVMFAFLAWKQSQTEGISWAPSNDEDEQEEGSVH